MTRPDDEAWLTTLLERRSPPAPDDFSARVLERLPRQPRPLRHRLGLMALWGTLAVLASWGASALSPASGTPHPVMAFCLGTALLWYLADR